MLDERVEPLFSVALLLDPFVMTEVLGVVSDVAGVKSVVPERDEVVLAVTLDAVVRVVEARAGGLVDKSGCAWTKAL